MKEQKMKNKEIWERNYCLEFGRVPELELTLEDGSLEEVLDEGRTLAEQVEDVRGLGEDNFIRSLTTYFIENSAELAVELIESAKIRVVDRYEDGTEEVVWSEG